jgi:2-C-methyl-D-erythritol 4-phosphate cytidylyltransferase
MPTSDRFAGAVVVAAGKSERYGHRPKVLEMAGGKPLLAWSIEALSSSSCVREMVIVGRERSLNHIQHIADDYADRISIRTCPGGTNRQDSVRAGVRRLAEHLEVAVIQDAARPLVTSSMIDSVAVTARKHGAAITAAAVTDTIKLVDGERVVKTLPREQLWAAQTPQAFRLVELRTAVEAYTSADRQFTDEAGLFEELGHDVRVCPATTVNIKVTFPQDLVLVGALLADRKVNGGHDVSS